MPSQPTTKAGTDAPVPVPVLLLKTRSGPTDAYAELFSAEPASPEGAPRFEPSFVPVLQHRFDQPGLARVRGLLREGRVNAEYPRRRGQDHPSDAVGDYGGLIFTSQRAVEAFAQLVREGQDAGWPQNLGDIPLYSVGPATTRALRAIPVSPPLQVFGDHTGNGEALAPFIQDHYAAWYAEKRRAGGAGEGSSGGQGGGEEQLRLPPLLFLVGEQRRDVIPRKLQDPLLAVQGAEGQRLRIGVTEMVVYGTGVMESFARDFAAELARTASRAERWVVVFSPTGCDSMLEQVGAIPGGGAAAGATGDGGGGGGGGRESLRTTTHIATIGPTTRDHLTKTFGFAPDVCAEKPSPEGVWEGIAAFRASKASSA